ncbi:hypothetical protein D3C80_1833350 [compost metagenome]
MNKGFNRLVLEQIRGGNFITTLRKLHVHLNNMHGVAAQMKKVIPDTNSLDTDQFRPYRGNRCFLLVAGSNIRYLPSPVLHRFRK